MHRGRQGERRRDRRLILALGREEPCGDGHEGYYYEADDDAPAGEMVRQRLFPLNARVDVE